MNIDVLIVVYVLIVTTYYILVNAFGMILNLFPRPFNVRRDYTYRPTVSVVMSCFNEGRLVYNTIKSMRHSSYPLEKLEIIAFDDCSSDDSFDWMKKAALDFNNVRVFRSKKNQGKAHNVLDAVAVSSGEIIVSIDSDCIFDPAAISELMACFSEKKIAAVGGRVGISNANDNWLTRFQTMAYALSFLVIKTPEKIVRKIQCLSGPLVAIRRECFNEIKSEIACRNFLGVRITNGEDRALTQMLLLKGYNTYLNNDALCYTSAPNNIGQYAKQQLRWRRSAIGQFFQLIHVLPALLKNNGFMASLLSMLPIFVLLSWNMLIITACFAGKALSSLLAIVICHLTFGPCVAVGFFVFSRWSQHQDLQTIRLSDLVFCRVLAAFWYPISTIVITWFALFTLDDGGWVTREEGSS